MKRKKDAILASRAIDSDYFAMVKAREDQKLKRAGKLSAKALKDKLASINKLRASLNASMPLKPKKNIFS